MGLIPASTKSTNGSVLLCTTLGLLTSGKLITSFIVDILRNLPIPGAAVATPSSAPKASPDPKPLAGDLHSAVSLNNEPDPELLLYASSSSFSTSGFMGYSKGPSSAVGVPSTGGSLPIEPNLKLDSDLPRSLAELGDDAPTTG